VSRGGRALLRLVAGLLFGAALLLFGEQGWLTAKACAARVLIDRAFEAHLADGKIHLPWAWADTHPLATIRVPRLGIRRVILAGASGSSLAFGPGHLDGTAQPNGVGNAVVAGHRDGAFAFLCELRRGDLVQVTTKDARVDYRVREVFVTSMWDGEVTAPSTSAELTLVTCHPVGGVLPTDARLVVVCEPVGAG
jgi:sortase A